MIGEHFAIKLSSFFRKFLLYVQQNQVKNENLLTNILKLGLLFTICSLIPT